ncbi:MAG: hotdog fold thioesterase [Rickettsiales bacterium]|nr:hotdog fold thioesterase [Rickettsiales bacterium]
MTVWKEPKTVEQLNERGKNTLPEALGMELIEVGDDFLKATMPVDHRTKQPLGILHGGASVALAETLGSIAANMATDPNSYCVGLEINANHVAKASEGLITGITKPVHLGRKTQIWEIKTYRQDGKLNCISRITMAVLQHNT